MKLPLSSSSFSISTQIDLILRRSATSVIPLSVRPSRSIFFTFYHFISQRRPQDAASAYTLGAT